jgi:glycosyltransferase involved in cell wall biosynthesis
MYQGIDPFRWYEEKGMVLKHPCVGLLQSAMIWGKTREMLILENVVKSMPETSFYWVGDGPYKEKILSILNKYENFHWLGSLEYPDKVRQYLSEIDVYALVSGIDMSPLTLQEAQLMKKPVIATNVGGIPELMKDKETGFLVEKGNVNQLIEKITLLLENKQKRIEMGNSGRKFIENNFSWEVVVSKFLEEIKNKK